MAPPTLTWFDRAARVVAPRWALNRLRAQATMDLMARHYEGAASGRRTQGWSTSRGDVNAVVGVALEKLRVAARDLVRNNPYAESAVTTIADHAVAWGIPAQAPQGAEDFQRQWDAWANTTACDADGRHDLAGLQWLAWRTVVESGEVLVRRRWRRDADQIPLGFQIQIVDPDFLDHGRDTAVMTAMSAGGPRIVQGVQFDSLGRREGYWLFPEHPGSRVRLSVASVFVPAREVVHVFKTSRPGQVRGPSWFAPVLLRMRDFDEFEDATLMKQKIAACLAVLTVDPDGTAAETLGTADPNDDTLDLLQPGMIRKVAPGQDVKVVDPPQSNEYDAYAKTQLRAIATGLGVTYEDLTGDYTGMPFSAARMSRMRHELRVHGWRWRTLIPQFCDPVWTWAAEAYAAQTGRAVEGRPTWSPPPLPMVDPQKEGAANRDRVRNGHASPSMVVREMGYDPAKLFAEIAADLQTFDALGLKLDCDPRHLTQAGQLQGAAAAPPDADDEDEDAGTDPEEADADDDATDDVDD